MISGRALLFVVLISVALAYGAYWFYILLLPKFKKWWYKCNIKYTDYEINNLEDAKRYGIKKGKRK